MIPRDFYHRPLTVGLFAKLFLFGLFAAFLGVPLASAMHAFGHAFFGMAVGCTWSGVFIPMNGHGQALVDFPSALFPTQPGFAWYAYGGFFWVGALLAAILFFPTADALPQNLFLQVLGFHLAFWGFLKEAMAVWPGGERGALSGGGPPPGSAPWLAAAAGLLLTALFAVRAVRILGQGIHCTFFTPLFLSLALWFVPGAAAVAALFMAGGTLSATAALGGALMALLLLSPLFGSGPRLWREPVFAPWLYALALAGAAALGSAWFWFGWGRGAAPLVWGTVTAGAAR